LPGVAETRLAELAGGQSLRRRSLFEPSVASALSERARPQAELGAPPAAGRSSHGGIARLQILFEGFDRRFLAHETLSDLRHLTLEARIR